MKYTLLSFILLLSMSFGFAQQIPVAKIGDMEFMILIHQKSKKYSIKNKIKEEQYVYVRIFLNKNGNQIDRKIMKSTDEKLNKKALKYVKSYKEGWIIEKNSTEEERSFVMPVIFSTKLNIDNQ